MTKFSVGIVDGEGPSYRSPHRKRPRNSEFSSDEDDIFLPSNRSPPPNHSPQYSSPYSQREPEGYEESEPEGEDEPEHEVESEEEDDELEGDGEESGAEQAAMSPEISRDDSISFTLTDPDVLDCPICYVPLTLPVFQCNNGHLACSTCCSKINKICPACFSPIGHNRCRAIENILESVKVVCQNSKYGCREAFSYSMKQKHEATCPFAPCSCPLAFCNFKASSMKLFGHLGRKHKLYIARSFQFNRTVTITCSVSEEVILLQEERDESLFILNNKIETLGNVVNLIRIGPSVEKCFEYELIAKAESGGGSLRLQSSTTKQVDDPPSTGFILVPFQFSRTTGKLEMELQVTGHAAVTSNSN